MTNYRATITLDQNQLSMVSYTLGLLEGIAMQMRQLSEINAQDRVRIEQAIKKAHDTFMPIREQILSNLEVIKDAH